MEKQIEATAKFAEQVYNKLAEKLVELNGKMSKEKMIAFINDADFAKIMMEDLGLAKNYLKNVESEYINILKNVSGGLSKTQQATLATLSKIDNMTFFNHVRDAGDILKQVTLQAIIGEINQNQMIMTLLDATKQLSEGQIGSLLNTNLRTFSRSTFAESVADLPDDTLVQYVGGVPISTSRQFAFNNYMQVFTIKEAKTLRNDMGDSAWINGCGFNCRHSWIVVA